MPLLYIWLLICEILFYFSSGALLPVPTQLSGMSADGLHSSAAAEWRGWAKAHTSAAVIIPPECCWPQIQDIRR